MSSQPECQHCGLYVMHGPCFCADCSRMYREKTGNLVLQRDELLGLLESAVQQYDNNRKWHSATGGDEYPDSAWILEARAAIAKVKK